MNDANGDLTKQVKQRSTTAAPSRVEITGSKKQIADLDNEIVDLKNDIVDQKKEIANQKIKVQRLEAKVDAAADSQTRSEAQGPWMLELQRLVHQEASLAAQQGRLLELQKCVAALLDQQNTSGSTCMRLFLELKQHTLVHLRWCLPLSSEMSLVHYYDVAFCLLALLFLIYHAASLYSKDAPPGVLTDHLHLFCAWITLIVVWSSDSAQVPVRGLWPLTLMCRDCSRTSQTWSANWLRFRRVVESWSRAGVSHHREAIQSLEPVSESEAVCCVD